MQTDTSLIVCVNPFKQALRIKEKAYRERTTVKAKNECRRKTQEAIKSRIILKTVCAYCANPKVCVHHKDYSNHLDVIFLCRKCHDNLHAGIITLQQIERIK